MSCQLDKVLKAINEVAGEVKNPQAIKQLNELKSALTEFAGAMESNTVKSYKNLITDIEGTTVAEALGVKENVIEEATPLMPINKVNPQIAKELQGCSK